MQEFCKGCIKSLVLVDQDLVEFPVMTDLLFKDFPDYTVVECSKIFSTELMKRYTNLTVINCYFEKFIPTRKYNNIILGHVLEHVDNPILILELCKSWLTVGGGKILSAVPNSHSIHRQAAVKMGLLRYEKELNETDRGVGHQRVYDMDSLIAEFNNAGLRVLQSGGYWLKPISNKQLDENWTDEMIMAFMKLGEEYPNIAAEIYVVASK